MVAVGLPGVRERHPRPFGWDLATHGDRVAVVTDSEEITYRRLASLVAEATGRLGVSGATGTTTPPACQMPIIAAIDAADFSA